MACLRFRAVFMATRDWRVWLLLAELDKVSIFFHVLVPLYLRHCTAARLLIIMTAFLLIHTLIDEHYYFSLK